MSRLGNPLVNEVLIPLGTKNYWNSQPPSGDRRSASHVSTPELAGLLPVLHPGVFPSLARRDLHTRSAMPESSGRCPPASTTRG